MAKAAASAAPLHLRALAAAPRPTGTTAAEQARDYCIHVLATLGFRVAERPFTYSGFPGRWGAPAAGIWLAVVLGVAAYLGVGQRPWWALVLVLVGGVLAAMAGHWLARRGVLTLPLLRARGINLEATRGAERPRVWMVAHLDSKSQGVPMLLRVAAVVGVVLAWLAVFVTALWAFLAPVPWWWWAVIGVAGVVCGLTVALTVVGARSPGAVDDASGVAAVLDAAALLPRHAAVGVLLTDAEELGLAGARAWVRDVAPGTVLNCDGVDDAGTIRVMYAGRQPRRLTDVVRRVARETGELVDVRRVLPGVLVDAVAFGDAGWKAVTVSRGTAATLCRIHTRADDLEHLTGAGIAAVAQLLAAVAMELS